MHHSLTYSGAFETNFAALKPGATAFTGTDGAQHSHHPSPPDVDGLRFYYMEKPGKHFVAVRIVGGGADVVLPNPLLLEASKHMGHGKRFGAEPTVVDDEMALVILGDVLARNPPLRDALKAMRDKLAKK